jgi:TonB-linked SusC/RagA family outer membrane protein
MIKRLLFTCSILLFLLGSVYAQTRKVTGKVTDKATGENLIGVSITVKNAKIGTSTDAQGRFSMTLPTTGAQVLVVKYVGYNSVDIDVQEKTNIQVGLEASPIQLNEVVSVGYGTVRKRDLTGAVSSLTAKQLQDIPLNSAAQALAGRLAGVQVTASEGSPDASFRIRIRGGGSITQDNSPLYVIDGVQIENGISTISPQDIESLDVLKDAASTAIYGARGANGVVIITTKSGRNAQPRLTYNGFVGFNKLSKKLNVLSPYEFVVYQYERSRNSIKDSTNFVSQYGQTWSDLERYKTIPAEDWQENVMGRNALMQTHNLSILGGTQTTKYNIGFTNNEQAGILINSDYRRNLVNMKLDQTVGKILTAGLVIRYNNEFSNGGGTSNSGASSLNSLRSIVKYRPFTLNGVSANEYDPNYTSDTNAGNGLSVINPYQLANSTYRKRYTTNLNISAYGSLKFNDYFSYRVTLGINNNKSTLRAFDDVVTPNAQINGSGQPLAGITITDLNTINLSNVVNFTNSKSKSLFSKTNRIDALVGQELYNLESNSLNNQFRQFPVGISPENAFNQLTLATVVPTYPQATYYASKLLSFFTRVNYAYKDRYLATVNYRADGSSKFAPGRNWGYFPSGSVAWRISEEGFMKNINAISDLKLRVSYGLSGNNRINDYLYQTVYNATSLYALGGNLNTVGYASPYLGNADLKWETTVSRNIGLDVALLKSRLQLTVDMYKNNTRDLLLNAPISFTSGYKLQLQNRGETQNTGVETQLNAVIIDKKKFKWTADFNLSFNRNKIVKLTESQEFYFQNSNWGLSGQPADFIVQVGRPVGTMYGYVYDGYYGINDFNYDATTRQYTLKAGAVDPSKVIGTAQPGLLKFKDINGDGIITDADKQIIGDANPKFTGGLNQQFRYKNFDLSVFLNFVYGNKILNANKLEFTSGYTANTNLLEITGDRWRNIDANGNVLQRLVTVGGKSVAVGEAPEVLAAANANATLYSPNRDAVSFFPSTFAIENGSFLRVNNVSLGYTFSGKILKRIRVSNMRIYGTVNNLATITNYSGYDPEVDARRGSPVTPGVDYSAYPRSRTYIFGANLSF